jgi:hypothetical protein
MTKKCCRHLKNILSACRSTVVPSSKFQRDFSLLWSYHILFFILSFSRPLIFRNWFSSSGLVFCPLGLSSTFPLGPLDFRFAEFGVLESLILDLGTMCFGPAVTGHKKTIYSSPAVLIYVPVLSSSTSSFLHRFF